MFDKKFKLIISLRYLSAEVNIGKIIIFSGIAEHWKIKSI